MELRKLRTFYSAILVIYLIAILFSLFNPSFGTLSIPAGSDKLVHFAEFFLLTFILYKTLELYTPNRRLAPFFSLFILALATELIQLFIPHRAFGWLDFLADSYGITLGMITYLAISWKR